MASFIRTGDHITIVFDDGVSATVYSNTSQFKDVRDALNTKNWDRVRELALPAEQVVRQVQDNFNEGPEAVSVQHGIVRYKGKELHGTLADRMVQMLSEGFDISALKLFLINLHQNPSFRAVNELYAFLERGNLPITDDGHFLAYKKVRADYRDVHSGTYDNSIGQICEMARNEVDEDSRNECSNGLHFCSRNYLANFGGERTMIVKINPRDVVAIPADYNMSKGRTCRYEVIGELEDKATLEGAYRDTRPTPPPAPESVGWHQTADGGWTDGDDEDDEEEWEDEEFDEELDICDDPLCDVCGEEIVARQEEIDAANRAIEEAREQGGIPAVASAFAGLPDGDTVTVPRSVALEIAATIDEDEGEDDDVEAVVAIHRNPNQFLRFDTIKDAAEYAGVTTSAIRRVLRGDRKTTGGYEWLPANGATAKFD